MSFEFQVGQRCLLRDGRIVSVVYIADVPEHVTAFPVYLRLEDPSAPEGLSFVSDSISGHPDIRYHYSVHRCGNYWGLDDSNASKDVVQIISGSKITTLKKAMEARLKFVKGNTMFLVRLK